MVEISHLLSRTRIRKIQLFSGLYSPKDSKKREISTFWRDDSRFWMTHPLFSFIFQDILATYAYKIKMVGGMEDGRYSSYHLPTLQLHLRLSQQRMNLIVVWSRELSVVVPVIFPRRQVVIECQTEAIIADRMSMWKIFNWPNPVHKIGCIDLFESKIAAKMVEREEEMLRQLGNYLPSMYLFFSIRTEQNRTE